MNYQKEMEQRLEALTQAGQPATLLLHSCCGPCSSYVLEYLWDKIPLTVFFYNPNIEPREEYERRKAEQLRLIKRYQEMGRNISYLDCDYDHSAFSSCAKGLEAQPEGGLRCKACFALRLGETARRAKAGNFSHFATTLTVSPHKNAALINQLGFELAAEVGLSYLPSDFKKRDGYRRSLALSKAFDLYRQDYCGCLFSLAAKDQLGEP